MFLRRVNKENQMSDQSHKSRISEMVRYAVAIVILLAMVFLAVNSYQAITTMQNENNDFRKRTIIFSK